MYQLNETAFKMLVEEINKNTGDNQAGKVQRQILVKRLEKLRQQKGEPVNQQELENLLLDILPKFSPQVIKKAAIINQKQVNKKLGCLLWFLLLGGGIAGLITLINMPWPIVRKPINKVAPILLLPSYMQMDTDYKQATSLVAQADQLVNQATSAADIQLGELKVKQAQESLNRLPVWFLGERPDFYCHWASCAWGFTYDEFETARKNIGKMEAVVFQEKNAQINLNYAELALNTAKQNYQQASPGEAQQQAIIAWQNALDQMKQIPPQTLAYKMVQPKLTAAERDFNQVVGDTTNRKNANNLIEAAKQYAFLAGKASQNPPHSAKEWEEIEKLWLEATQQLKMISPKDDSYVDAQKKLAEYQKNLGIIRLRKESEQSATEALKNAKALIPRWQKMAGAENASGGELSAELQQIINQLETVQTGTTAYKEAQELLKFARTRQKELQEE